MIATLRCVGVALGWLTGWSHPFGLNAALCYFGLA